MLFLALFASVLSCCLACWAGSSDSSRGNDRWVPVPVPGGGGYGGGFGGFPFFGRKKRDADMTQNLDAQENTCVMQCVQYVQERTDRPIEDVKTNCGTLCSDVKDKWLSTLGEIRKEEQEKLQRMLTRQ